MKIIKGVFTMTIVARFIWHKVDYHDIKEKNLDMDEDVIHKLAVTLI
jgi:hypothetical protein